MEGKPFHIIHEPDFTALFMLGADDIAETVENVDAELTLGNGTRWSATFMTPEEISRIMDRWSRTGEYAGGAYFQCPDLVIVPRGGISTMLAALRAIVDTGGPEGRLGRLTEQP